MVRTVPPKIVPSPWGICTNSWFHGPTRVFILNGISIGSAVLYGSQMLCCIQHSIWEPYNGEENHVSGKNKIAHSLRIRHPAKKGSSHGHIGNMHKIFGKDRACGLGDARGQTDRQTDRQTCSLQYFAIAPAAK